MKIDILRFGHHLPARVSYFFHEKILQVVLNIRYKLTPGVGSGVSSTITFIVIRLHELIFTKKIKKDILSCTAHLADQLTFSFFSCLVCLHNAYNFYWICNANISKNIARLFFFFFFFWDISILIFRYRKSV